MFAALRRDLRILARVCGALPGLAHLCSCLRRSAGTCDDSGGFARLLSPYRQARSRWRYGTMGGVTRKRAGRFCRLGPRTTNLAGAPWCFAVRREVGQFAAEGAGWFGDNSSSTRDRSRYAALLPLFATNFLRTRPVQPNLQLLPPNDILPLSAHQHGDPQEPSNQKEQHRA